jgi:hypothetical protein
MKRKRLPLHQFHGESHGTQQIQTSHQMSRQCCEPLQTILQGLQNGMRKIWNTVSQQIVMH